MMEIVKNEIANSNAKIVVFDIDGTLKDLCKEHDTALEITMKADAKKKVIRRKIAIFFDRIAMSIVKAGILPTNAYMQDILVTFFSLMLFVNPKKFLKDYYKNYKEQLFLFDGAYELIEQVCKTHIVFFATINKQNYNLERYGINQEQIVYSVSPLKRATYKEILNKTKMKNEDVIIVGDNIMDDMYSARKLNIKHILVNNYNSKFKKMICKIFNNKYLRR